jgi:GntR family transcriptional regulator/MocR family aminotransferase
MPVQLGVAGFIAGGHLAQHVRKMRRRYRERREVLLGLLREQFGPWLEVVPSSYGMHVAVRARTPIDLEGVTEHLAAAGVQVHTLRRYYLGPPGPAGLVIGYGAVDGTEIRRGLGALRTALDI